MAQKDEKAVEIEDGTSDVTRVADTEKGFDIAPGEPSHGLRTVDVGLIASQVITDVDKQKEARILRKVDLRLVPLLAFLYL